MQNMWNLLKNVCAEKPVLVKICLQIDKKMSLPLRAWISSTEKVTGAAVSKEFQIEKNYHYCFPLKGYNCKYCFLLPTPLENFTLLNGPSLWK